MISFVKKVPPGLRNNEEGFVLVTSLMILLVLMVVGIATTSTTSTEVKIAGNEKRYKQNFYKAEGATLEMAQIIENAPDNDLKDWSTSGLDREEKVDLDDNNLWIDASPTSFQSSLDPLGKVRCLAIDKGVSKGGSLDMTNPSRIHVFDIYGHAEKDNSNVTIMIGYKKRY